MITINSDTPYLGIAYAELLDFDQARNQLKNLDYSD